MPRKKSKSAPRARAAPARPASPGKGLVERPPHPGAVTVTPAGILVVEQTAREGGSQAMIASRLGIALSVLKELFKRQPATRLAYERGVAELEHELTTMLLTAARKGGIVPIIYFTKARLGWSETPAPAATQVGIQIVLPDALTSEQYAERLRLYGPPVFDDRGQLMPRVLLAAPVDVESKEIER